MTPDADPGPRPGPTPADSGVVAVTDRQGDLALATDRWAELLRRVLVAEGVVAPWEAGLWFVDADRMATLNADHRGVEGPTDVLAFGADDGSALRADGEPRLVGDVVICPAVAAANAAAHGRTVEDELALLVVHGGLHLLGYDHVDDGDARQMQQREQELLATAPMAAPVAATAAGASAGRS
ncbi:rRNA maturation RNase YbeY [Candidatus Poriferisocius sp.]|uniref:rRNA maturation RNase YbeY n=1 Tax=Candidatus Poriferisocius sp. TaxID=3101276 RepID=UPI003B59A724